METILYTLFGFIASVHSYIMTLNDHIENNFTDKELHFIVIGALGIIMIFVIHPIFLWLAKKNHTMVISFLYVATVIFVVTFAIEIGQGITGTGLMELDDIIYGIAGFLAFFLIFLTIRAIIHIIVRLANGHSRGHRY